MNVYLFGFQKKKNSTLQPALTDGTLFPCQLKDDTTVLNPVLVLNASSQGMPVPFTPSFYTYAFIDKFSRYYIVTDWKYVSGLWECYLSVDALATYKNLIGNLSEYILRSSYTFATEISDGIYPTTTNYAVTKSMIDLGLSTTGFYVVGIISNSSSVSEGAISYYIMTASQMANFKSYLMSETFLSNNGLASLAEIDKNLVKCIYNPYQYIVSCKFFPFTVPSGMGTSVTSVNFGWWTIPQSAKLISGLNTVSKQSPDFTAPEHPQASRGRYLNHAPFTEIYVMQPFIGTVVLDSNKIEATNKVRFTVTCDLISGDAIIDITNMTRGLRLYESVITFAQDIPLAQMSQDVLGMARSAVDTVGGAVSGFLSGGIGGAIANAASGIINTLESSIPIMQSSGVNGNKANYYVPADFYVVHRQVVNEDRAHKGRPLCDTKVINTIPGYIVCSDAHAEISCYDTERSTIIDYMNNGFYYE